MKNDNAFRRELGKRIRDRRKKLGITQAQLCGDYMTRNMLSRIETGDASPSLETLLFIAQKLKLPPAFFLCRDAKEEAEYTKTVRIKDAKRMLGTAQYKKCIDVCQDLPSDDDEVAFMTTVSHILLAVQLLDKGELRDADAQLDHAAKALHKTVYMYSELQAQIRLVHLLTESLAKGTPPDISAFPDSPPAFFSKDRFLYVIALSNEVSQYDSISADSIYRTHLEGRSLLHSGNPESAMPLLERAVSDAAEAHMEYFALMDLESAAQAIGDFKTAYTLAKKRIELNSNYNNNN